MIEVRYRRGIHLPEVDLWLDAREAKPFGFVSHAHSDHVGRHAAILCSRVTASLLRARYNIPEHRLQPVDFHVPVVREGFRLRLLPAGHIAGSAMLHVTRIRDNATLLYTGDFKLRGGRTVEPATLMAADTLIVETTFALPVYQFPSPMEVEAGVLRFVNDAIADGETPVLLAYALGKAQEVVALLEENDIPVLQHAAVAEMTDACRAAGVENLRPPVVFDGHAPAGHVIVAPPHAVRTKAFLGLKAKRCAMLSGWALKPGMRYRYGSAFMLPLSDHADHPALLECLRRVRPKRVLTVHGHTREFAAELRGRGIDAWSAEGGDQMELPISHPPTPAARAARPGYCIRPICGLADFSDVCRLLAETGSRVAKAGFLKTYWQGLPSDEERRVTATWLAGAEPQVFRIPVLRQALVFLPGATIERYRQIYAATKDFLIAARTMLDETSLKPEPLSILEARDFLVTLADAPPTLARVEALASRLACLHAAEGETLCRLILADSVAGVDHALVAEVMAEAGYQFAAAPSASADSS